MVNAAIEGELDDAEFVTESAFGLSIPTSCPGVPAELLDPRNSWADKQSYDKTAAVLASKFEENFKKFDAPAAVKNAGPRKPEATAGK